MDSLRTVPLVADNSGAKKILCVPELRAAASVKLELCRDVIVSAVRGAPLLTSKG